MVLIQGMTLYKTKKLQILRKIQGASNILLNYIKSIWVT